MAINPIIQRREQLGRHDHGRIDRAQLLLAQGHTQAQAGRSSAVLHTLLEVEHLHFADCSRRAGQCVEILPDPLVVATLFRHDQQHAAVGPAEQLTVEQVGAHGVFHADQRLWHADRLQLSTTPGQLVCQLGQHPRTVEESLLVIKQHRAIPHRNHIVVEHALIDHRRILLGIHHASLIQAMQTGNRLAGLQGLPRRITLRCRVARIEGAAPKDKELHAGLTIVTTQAGMVGSALVSKLTGIGQRSVVGKIARISKHGAQYAAGCRMFDAAMELAVEIGRGEVHPAVGGIGTGADRTGVGCPHAGCRTDRSKQRQRLLRRLVDHGRVATREPQTTQGSHIRALLRGEHPLLEAHVHQCLHLRQALLGGLTRTG